MELESLRALPVASFGSSTDWPSPATLPLTSLEGLLCLRQAGDVIDGHTPSVEADSRPSEDTRSLVARVRSFLGRGAGLDALSLLRLTLDLTPRSTVTMHDEQHHLHSRRKPWSER